MGEFDIYKWNSQRRLAAVNEGFAEGANARYDQYIEEFKDLIKHVPSAGSIHNYIDNNRREFIQALIAVDTNQSIDKEIKTPSSRELEESVQPSTMYSIYNGIVSIMGDSFKAEFPTATDFERRLRSFTETE